MVIGAMEVKALSFVFLEEMFLLVCWYFTINSILAQMYIELHMTQGCYSRDEKLFTKLKLTMTRLIKITAASLTVRHNNYNEVVLTIKWAKKFRKKKPAVVRKA